MRVLFFTYAENSTLNGMVPLGWALRNAGHEVRVASQPALAGTIAQSGLTAVAVGRDHSFDSTQVEEGDSLVDINDEPMGADDYTAIFREFVSDWWEPVNGPALDDLVQFCRQWGPDLVIWEPMSFAAPVAARICGAAHARLPWSLDLVGRMRARHLEVMKGPVADPHGDPLGAWLTRRVEAGGAPFDEDLVRGQFTIDHFPPSLGMEPVPGVDRVPMRYIPYNGRGVLPPWLAEPAETPRVCVTLGVDEYQRTDSYPTLLEEVMEAVSGLEAEVVVTLDERLGQGVPGVPDNVRFVGFVPLHALLLTCDAVLHHGGSGSMLTSAVAAVPQLALAHPVLYDAAHLGERLSACGAGLGESGGDRRPKVLAERLRTLLEDPVRREGAQRLRDEITEMPSPGEVVRELERRVHR